MRSQPALRIGPPAWLSRPAVRAVHDAIGNGRFVGGAVRDTLLGRPVGDLDLATPLPPGEVMARLGRAGIKTIPTGLAHGTVTALAGREPIEITTLRRDVETDGRHAVVAYTEDWAEDAARRDFTMNALYLDGEGGVWDPTGGGLADCRAGRVRFVGEARRRIAEDVLRLLRFYRFQAQYGRTPPDPEARAACRAMAGRLPELAGERVHAELLKLLAASDPASTLRLMAEDGVLAVLLPGPPALDRLAALVPLEPAPDSLRRLAALIGPADPPAMAERLRLSVEQRTRLAALCAAEPAIDLAAGARAQRRLIYRLGAALYRDRVLLEAAANGKAAPVPALLALAEAWPEPKLPVTGADARALGIPPGKRLGNLLRAVEAWWIEGDFRADRAACLARLRELCAATAPGGRAPAG